MTTVKENNMLRKVGNRKAKYSWLNVKFGWKGATLIALVLTAFLLCHVGYHWDYSKAVISPENSETGLKVIADTEVVTEEQCEKTTVPDEETLELEYPAIPQFPDKVLEPNDPQAVDDSVVPKTIKPVVSTRGSGYTSGVLHQ
jgi:hypothetical protein